MTLVTERDALVLRLEDEIARLRRELADKDQIVSQERHRFETGAQALRRQLQPLYAALQQVFGEFDGLGGTEALPAAPGAGPSVDARTAAIWASWKQRLGPMCAKIIEALLLQPGMTNRQLAVAVGTKRIQTIYEAVTKLNKAELLTKTGDSYFLRTV